MRIQIIAAGKVREPWLVDGIAEYSKRLSKYCTVEIIEVQTGTYLEEDDIERIEDDFGRH